MLHDFCLTIPYGMLLGLGGVIGYVNSGSTMSIMAGGASGALLTLFGYCSYYEWKQSPLRNKIWPALSLAVSGTLTVVMGNRCKATGVVFPSGIVAAASAGMSFFYVLKLVEGKKKHNKKY